MVFCFSRKPVSDARVAVPAAPDCGCGMDAIFHLILSPPPHLRRNSIVSPSARACWWMRFPEQQRSGVSPWLPQSNRCISAYYRDIYFPKVAPVARK